MHAGENCICSYGGVNVVPHSSPLVYFPHLSSVSLIFSNSSPPLISPLLLLLLLSSTAHHSPVLKPRLSTALHPFSTSVLLLFHPPLFSSTLSFLSLPFLECRAARREDTVMLSLLGWHNSTSLWGVKALTLPFLSVCLPACLCSSIFYVASCSSLSTSQPFLAYWLVLILLSVCLSASLPACLPNKL